MRGPGRRRTGRIVRAALLVGLVLPPPASAAEEAFASAEVVHSPAAVWAVLSDFARWDQVFPSVASVAVERVDAHRVRLHLRTAVAGQLVRYTLATTVDAEARRIESTLDPSAPADVVALTSSWRVRETPAGGTRIELHVRSQSGLALPGFVERRFTERSTRQSVAALVSALATERRVAHAAASD